MDHQDLIAIRESIGVIEQMLAPVGGVAVVVNQRVVVESLTKARGETSTGTLRRVIQVDDHRRITLVPLVAAKTTGKIGPDEL